MMIGYWHDNGVCLSVRPASAVHCG